MKAQGIKSGYAFSRNPIILKEDFPLADSGLDGGAFTVDIDGTVIYEGRFYPPLCVDLSEILDAYVSFFPEPPEDNSDPLVMIEDAEELACREFTAAFEFAGEETEFSCTVIPGGISRQNFRRMVSTGQDIFSARFLNPENNFFLTTRTAGWRIVMKETELYPLYFFVTESAGEMSVKELATGSVLTFADLAPGVYALDIDALRRRFMSSKGIIPNLFDISMGGLFSCRIVVERAAMSRDRYRLKFRNSLGVYEIIELTGPMSVSPDYSEAGEASFMRHDPVAGGFFSDRERVERRMSVTVETGVKRPDEVRFLMDMLGSEDVYLLGFGQYPVKAIPSVDGFSFSPRPDKPENFKLKLDIADSETNIMQEIADGTEGRRPRVFSGQFTEQFN